jgi:esterase/lipase superfamily enzyme
MNVQYYEWYSHNVGKNMGVIRYGHWGPAMVYYPTSGGDHREFERYGMQYDAKPWIDAGKVQFFCIDSVNNETFYNRNLHPADKMNWNIGYEKYIVEELIPFIYDITQNDFIGSMGCSFGGYTTANFFFKHPEIFSLGVAMSATFDISSYMYGYHDSNIYFNNPPEYLANLNDPYYYHMYNNNSVFWMFCGDHDICKGENEDFSNLLNHKGIRHWYDRWPAPCDHNEYWWKKMLPVVLDRFYNW